MTNKSKWNDICKAGNAEAARKLLTQWSLIEIKSLANSLDVPPHQSKANLINSIINVTIQAKLNSDAIRNSK